MNERPDMRPRLEKPVKLDSAYGKAKALAEREALRLELFVHEDESGSNRQIIENDLKYVRERTASFRDTDTHEYRLAKAFEAALYDRVNQDKWFGSRAQMVMPSEYDDLKNGIDGILEFQERQGSKTYLGLAVDVTYNRDPSKKFQIIKEQIDGGRLGFVKYFRSSDGSFEGNMRNLPRAVLALNAADASRVVRDWDENVPAGNDEFRLIMLYQLHMQMAAYQAYAQSRGKTDAQGRPLAAYFEGARRSLAALLSDTASKEQLGRLAANPTVAQIREQLKLFEPEKKSGV